MMECKRALQETAGDQNAAVEFLRKTGKKTMESRAGRDTAFGRIGIFADMDSGSGAMVELLCESAPVAGHEEFVALANNMAKTLATEKVAESAEEILAKPNPGKQGQSLQEALDDITNRIREVLRVGRLIRFDGPCGGYVHHSGDIGVLLEVSGGDATTAKDICMHIAARRPRVLAVEDLDAKDVEKEREILTAAARQEGKPENIIAKMVEGRLKNFYAEEVLLEQPFVKDEKMTVGKLAKDAGMKLQRFVRWQIGQ